MGGIAAGGTTGQVLVKLSNADRNVGWANSAGTANIDDGTATVNPVGTYDDGTATG